MRSSTLSKAFGVFVVAILAGCLIGWWASRESSRTAPPPVEVSDVPIEKNDGPVSSPRIATANKGNDPVIPAAPQPEVEVASTNVLDDPALWEEKLDEILGSDTPEDQKGEELLAMMTKVGTEAQIELAGHIVNLLDDDQFHKTSPYLTNAAVSEEISSIFMNDLYNRDDVVKLPLLLEVAKNEQHALRDEARDLLELYVEEDYGTNWVQWEEATKKYLKEQELEEAAATNSN